MKNEAQYPPYILYRMFSFVILLREVVFQITTACLPAKEMVLFLYWVLKMEVFFLSCDTNYPVSVVLWNIQVNLSNKPNV